MIAYQEKNSTNIENEFLVKLFIGKKYEKFVNNKFNWCAFLFSGIYMCYRKSYMMVIYYLLCMFFLKLFGMNLLNFLLNFLLNLYCGFRFNKAYIDSAYKKVNKIRKKYQNLNSDEIIQLIKLLGGASIANVLFFFIYYIIIKYIFIIFIFLLINLFNQIN